MSMMAEWSEKSTQQIIMLVSQKVRSVHNDETLSIIMKQQDK
ncbi:hypothetical protein Vi05172_g7701 [Venturia inaequalis]|nr:hypothetical protein Vi05172_g7701 [Venturia inaequalis]